LFLQSELDLELDTTVQFPHRFESVAAALVANLDRIDADLEIRDSQSWRRVAPQAKASFPEQFRTDVDGIIPLSRPEEGRLARRIEFARRRHEIAEKSETPNSSRMVRRALELHALRSEMVERNLYLVLINVERYAQANSTRSDLIQEGCISLFRAVDGFDWRRGLLFRTYAVHWLNQAFRNYLYNNMHTVRVPVYLQKALKGIHQAAGRVGDGTKATPREIADVSDMNEGLISSALSAARSTYSLDADLSPSEDGGRLRDVLIDRQARESYQPQLEEVSLETGLGRALEGVGERERLVLCLRYGIGVAREHTLAEVAELLGVSVERVRQIQVRALAKLDTPTLRRELEPFVN
jgi:RNA polymerase primary sigma factor